MKFQIGTGLPVRPVGPLLRAEDFNFTAEGRTSDSAEWRTLHRPSASRACTAEQIEPHCHSGNVTSTLRMAVEETQAGEAALVPIVDGAELAKLVRELESAAGYEPAGGYAGIVPAHFRFGDLNAYYAGDDSGVWPRPGVIWLLGCDCGEVGRLCRGPGQ